MEIPNKVDPQEIQERTSTDYIMDATHEHYADLVNQGYSWRTNVTNEDAGNFADRIRRMGLDVFVGDVAFVKRGATTERYPAVKAILVREKRKE